MSATVYEREICWAGGGGGGGGAAKNRGEINEGRLLAQSLSRLFPSVSTRNIFSSGRRLSLAPHYPNAWNRLVCLIQIVIVTERFSFECRKTKTKEITLTNHNSCKQSNEPIRDRSKYMSPLPSAGKRVRVSHDWFWFYF